MHMYVWIYIYIYIYIHALHEFLNQFAIRGRRGRQSCFDSIAFMIVHMKLKISTMQSQPRGSGGT